MCAILYPHTVTKSTYVLTGLWSTISRFKIKQTAARYPTGAAPNSLVVLLHVVSSLNQILCYEFDEGINMEMNM